LTGGNNGSASNKANDIKKQANEAFSHKQYKKAIDLYTKALQVPQLSGKEYAILYSNRSVAYLESGDALKAYKDAKLAQQNWPNWSKAYFRKGAALDKLGKFTQAIRGLKYSNLLLTTW
jgi:tetratricopeptide (TPR) repeat protein